MSRVLAIFFTVATMAFYGPASAAGKLPITLNVAYTSAPGGTSDQLLSSGALTGAVLNGLRESGVAVVLNAPQADFGVQLNLTTLYSQQLDNLRVVSGTMSVRIPRPGAVDFGDAYSSCERGFFFWGGAHLPGNLRSADQIRHDAGSPKLRAPMPQRTQYELTN